MSGGKFRPERRIRPAAALRVDDYVHDDLAPMRVTGFEPAAPGIRRVVGRLQSGVEIRVQHPDGRLLEVTRLVDTPHGPHLSMVEVA